MRLKHWRQWYPRSWRQRYGEEYEQLLEDLESEQPLGWQSELDIMQSGMSLRRAYPGHRKGLLFAGASIGLAAVLGFGLGFGLRGGRNSSVAFAIAPGNGRIIAPCAVFKRPKIEQLYVPEKLIKVHGPITRIEKLKANGSGDLCAITPPGLPVEKIQSST